MENTTINQPKRKKKKKKKKSSFRDYFRNYNYCRRNLWIQKWSYSNSHEETDDAQIASNVSPVISKISGYVAEVKVKDNQFVKKGDTSLF